MMAHERGQFEATVASNAPVCREHFRLVLRLKRFPITQPGQFVQVACCDPWDEDQAFVEQAWEPGQIPQLNSAELIAPQAMLRRPFSLAGRRDVDGAVELDLIHRVVGVGTDWLSRLKTGDSVSVLGPLGNGFQLPGPDGMALLVGGGVGIPPMIYLAEKLRGYRAVAFAGAVTRDLLALTITTPAGHDVDPVYNVDEFSRFDIPTIITTDDGSYGFGGYVTQALEQYLDQQLAGNTSVIIYTCGPEPMMKRVADIAVARNISCQIAVERAMACGMGTCQSCCIKVKKPDPPGPHQPPMAGRDWAYRLACTDGPVFNAKDLLW